MKFYLLIATLLCFSCKVKNNSGKTKNQDSTITNLIHDNYQDQQSRLFEKIEYASFEQPRNNNVRINLYYSIDTTGLVTIRNDDDYHNTLTFNTYELDTTQLKKINSIFNTTNHLNQYIIKRKFNDDEFFQGEYKFFSVRYKNSTKDSLCFIVPFMSNNFQDIYDMLDSVYWADKKKLKDIPPFSIAQTFKNSVLLNYKKAGLPGKKALPSFRLEDQK